MSKARVVNLWRLARETQEYPANDLSGKGAAKFGGRWNPVRVPVVYAASNISLAALELLVHIGEVAKIRNLFLIKIDIPESIMQRADRVKIPSINPAWQAEPPGIASMEIGRRWVQTGQTLLLQVPSAIVPEESNFLINPAHTDSQRIRGTVVRQFVFDPRLDR
jgi:RES domain-containing protein